MDPIKPTYLRQNLYKILDEVLKTGEPVAIEREGEVLKLSLEKPKRITLDTLQRREDVIVGDPDELATLSWEDEVNLDLP